MPALTAGIYSLIAGYVLSQFYRAFLAVLSPALIADIGATPGDLALSSGIWFMIFAALQIPVGAALDRFGPRRVASIALGGFAMAGAAVFAAAQAPWHIHVAMALIGVGCSPILMSTYYIFARNYAPAAFGGLAGFAIGVGSLGNILSTSPLVALTEAIGWREAVWCFAALTLAIGILLFLLIEDPENLEADQPKGSLRELFQIRELWFILPMAAFNYTAAAAIRGLWAGPYLTDIYQVGNDVIGRATLAMGLAMVASAFLVGPYHKLVGNLRRAVILATTVTVVTLLILTALPAIGLYPSILLMTILGLSNGLFPLVMSHGRSYLPPHLVGRGITFINMLAIGTVGLAQFASRPIYELLSAAGDPIMTYRWLFAFYLIPLAIAFGLYFLTPEAKNEQ